MSALATIAGLAPKVVDWFGQVFHALRPPVKVEVVSLRYDGKADVDRRVELELTRDLPHYHATLRLTNRSKHAVWTSRIRLAVADGKPIRPVESEVLQLAPGQLVEWRSAFYLDGDADRVDAGPFTLTVTPAIGRATVVKGTFLVHGGVASSTR